MEQQAYLKKKGKKALKLAKALEKEKINKGSKYKRLDSKTIILKD
ncbi:hypothetical protein [uncultured Tenacibaculum sp.]|nr:hypothetical protein [uncultured Tenacibaculum sp.]